jgi:flagellar biosynthesis regulator FlaF
MRHDIRFGNRKDDSSQRDRTKKLTECKYDSASSARERISWKMLTNSDKGMNSSKVHVTWLIFPVRKSYAALPLKIMADVICLCLFLSGKEFKIVRHSTSFQLIINISVDIRSILIMTFSSLMPENNDHEYKLWIDSKRVWHGNSNLNFKVGSLRDDRKQSVYLLYIYTHSSWSSLPWGSRMKRGRETSALFRCV